MKPASPAQLAARKRFAEMARSGAFKKATKRKANPTSASNDDKGIYILEYKGFEVKAPYETGQISDFPILFANQNDAKKAEQRLKDKYAPYFYKSRVRKISAKEAKEWADDGYDVPKPNPAKKTVSKKISQLVHEGYPQRQAVAVALSEQRAGKVKRNPRKENSMKKVQIATNNGIYIDYKYTGYGVTQEKDKTFVYNQKTGEELYLQKQRYTLSNEKGQNEFLIDFEMALSEQRAGKVKRNPAKVKYRNLATDLKGDQRVGYSVHLASQPGHNAIAWFSKKADAVKVAQEAADRTGKDLAVSRVQNYFGAM
jgi:hypothetical protein